MKKVSISSWAIPQSIDMLCRGAKEMGFDGISLGGFAPFGANADLQKTSEEIETYRKNFTDNGLEAADYAIDLWAYDALKQTKEWRAAYTKALKYAKELDLTDIIRIDTDAKPVLPDGMTYDQVKAFYVKNFKEMAREAAEYGFKVVWEFEPGFIINEPSNIMEVVKKVDEPNFSLLFDTCHAYNCSLGLNAIEPEILDGGILEFIDMAKGYIGFVHVIDADGTLNKENTSEHVPFGDGKIDFDTVIPALIERGGYQGDWWAIDLCEWPDAWAVTEKCKKFVDAFNQKYCSGEEKKKMKVQNFYEPLVMKYEERDIPQIGDNEVLIKVMATAICGSDISYYYGHSPLGTPDGKGPLYLGHEISGIVAKIGGIPQKAGLFSVGDRVAVNPVQQCNACEACMRGEFNVCEHGETIGVDCNGGFAEYVKVKYTHVYKLPDKVSFEQGALAEPLACATYGIKRLDIQLGQDVVIFGPGPIGLMMVQLAKASGAGRVLLVGRRDYPLETGKQLGADFIVNNTDQDSPYYSSDILKTVKEKFGRLAPRCIVPTSSMQALQDALKVTGPASTIVYFGLPGPDDKLEVPMLEAINMDRTIKCAWLAPGVWDNVFHAINSGQVNLDPIITHRFTLEECEKGIRFMKESKENKIKGIVLIGCLDK